METYDIILQAGQSNAAGYGHGPAAHPYIPHERIVYLTGSDPMAEGYDPETESFSVEIAAERPNPEFGPEDRLGDLSLSFAQNYVAQGRLAEGRKLLILRTAVGATGFLKHHWGMDEPLYLRMLRMTDYALSLNPENRLVAMLWHQGEHEAAFLNDPQRYHGQLKALVESVRTRYDAPELPFVCGGFCTEWARKNQPACDNIMAVIRSVAEQVNGAYVETADLRSNNQKTGDGDEIHFCREDLQELGRRYYAAYQKLTK
jgi:hypothetical protein